MAEMEFGGVTFRGGRIFVLLTALSTLGGAAWAGFEFYKDYMDMKEIIQNIDTDQINARMDIVTTKLDEAIDYTRDIKSGLRDDILAIEKQVDRTEDMVRGIQTDVRTSIQTLETDTRAGIQNAEERFENKRDSLQNDYDKKANALRSSNDQRITDLTNKVERDIKELELRLNSRLQRALDNPLAN